MDSYPHPDVDFAGFDRALKNALRTSRGTFNPVSKRPAPWIDPAKLSRALKKGVCCSVSSFLY